VGSGQVSHGAWSNARRIPFIGVQVKFQAIVGRDPHHHITKDHAATAAVNCNLDDFMVADIQAGSVGWAHVNVAQGADYT